LTYSFWFSLSLRIMQTSLGFRLLDCSVFTLYNQFLRFPSVALLLITLNHKYHCSVFKVQ
jgi:hypothetical protein